MKKAGRENLSAFCYVMNYNTQTSHTPIHPKADNQAENRRSIMLQHMKMAMTYADKQVFWSKTCSKARKFVHQSNAAIP